MATWQVGPFDNDEAVEWCGVLEAIAPDRRTDLARRALEAAVPAGRAPTVGEAARAVAAAATILQSLTGASVSDSAYAPRFLLGRRDIRVNASLRDLATRALDGVLEDGSTWRLGWAGDVEEEDALAVIEELRANLASAVVL
ncbi:DUF4259 domain-containing protein [Micromonospora sp. RHAY321]|uniref:DUF4259 domain-containing protein n=1 Tax=Micromonospora sp. RHAY321 TaxID=2944807 RepID=UPI00207D04E4|nr:DUF4259 domain-containing protein [Micromonospora sp. RHAY321]MCO1593837.1 DUF4259 domain-containing protein [Micromonospora sp. RHAY321]